MPHFVQVTQAGKAQYINLDHIKELRVSPSTRTEGHYDIVAYVLDNGPWHLKKPDGNAPMFQAVTLASGFTNRHDATEKLETFINMYGQVVRLSR